MSRGKNPTLLQKRYQEYKVPFKYIQEISPRALYVKGSTPKWGIHEIPVPTPQGGAEGTLILRTPHVRGGGGLLNKHKSNSKKRFFLTFSLDMRQMMKKEAKYCGKKKNAHWNKQFIF